MTMSFPFVMFDYPRFYDWQSEMTRETRRKELQRVEALVEEAELEVLRLEALRLNSLLSKKAQLVALQLREVQLPQFGELRLGDSFRDLFEDLLEKRRIENLLRDLLRHVELIIAELRRRKELIQRFLAMLWQKHLESFLFPRNTSAFPNKPRPPCTTMPWNIRPALIVLWGVCWMFYNPWSPIDDAQLQFFLVGEQTWVLSQGIDPFAFKCPSDAADIFQADISNGLTEQHHL
jgi:hypothetical protein